MQNFATKRGVLHFLHEGEATSLFALDLELDEDVLARSMAEHERNIAPRDLKRLGLALTAIDDCRHRPLRLDFANRRTAGAGASRCREFYLFSHDV